MDYYKIGQRVRALRRGRDLSQEALAERVGISVTHMSHIETGNTRLSLRFWRSWHRPWRPARMGCCLTGICDRAGALYTAGLLRTADENSA